MKFKIAKNMELFWFDENKWISVDLKPCFPNTLKNQFFSIRDNDGKELVLLENLKLLEEDSKMIIEEYLKFKSFKFKIIGIYLIEEDFGVRHFEVKTVNGDRNFQTNLDDWPRLENENLVVINDIYGDQYHFQNLEFGQNLIQDYIN